MHYLWKFILLAVRLSFFRNLFIFQGRNWSEKTITNNLYEREASTRQNQVNYVLLLDIFVGSKFQYTQYHFVKEVPPLNSHTALFPLRSRLQQFVYR